MRISDWSSDVCSSDLTEALGVAVWRALGAAAPDADLPRLAIGVYLDEVHARGPVLAALSRPGSTIAAVADPGQAGVIFEVVVLHRFFGVDRRRATAVAGMAQGDIVGAVGTWLGGRADRGGLEAEPVAHPLTPLTPPPAG